MMGLMCFLCCTALVHLEASPLIRSLVLMMVSSNPSPISIAQNTYHLSIVGDSDLLFLSSTRLSAYVGC